MTVESQSAEPTPWTSVNEPRITTLWSLLRRLRIDKVPKLLNKLKGEMILFCPRAMSSQNWRTNWVKTFPTTANGIG
jgi:lipopolysaccharide/colanic/teichoic acid biosynthesis glycosyltransferase